MTHLTTLPERIKINDSNFVHSAAQGITLLAYGDSYNLPHRVLNYKTECESYNDFAACLRIIDNYNEFDAKEIIKKVNPILSEKRYYNENNPNNGNDLFKFEIGREPSPVFYVTLLTFLGNTTMPNFPDMKPLEYCNYTFKEEMKTVASLCLCDEFNIEDNEHSLTARFWFD